jgi:hypothetical protein
MSRQSIHINSILRESVQVSHTHLTNEQGRPADESERPKEYREQNDYLSISSTVRGIRFPNRRAPVSVIR